MTSSTAKKLSAAQVKKFAGFMKTWQQRLNLLDWRIVAGNDRANAEDMADVSTTYEDRLAVYRLGGFEGMKVTDHVLESTAVHELLHVLLEDLIEVCKDPSSSDALITATAHRVINTLEPILIPEND